MSLKAEVTKAANDLLDDAVKKGSEELKNRIDQRLGAIVNRVRTSVEGTIKERFSGVAESKMLIYNADNRSFDFVSTVLLAIVALILLPSYSKILAVFVFAFAGFRFLTGYFLASKIEVANGWVGVVCENGLPVDGKLAGPGLTRFWSPTAFAPFTVSTGQDQVVSATTVNVAKDYVNIGMTNQLVFRITNPAKFVSSINPVSFMRLLNFYASYVSLRIITSISDSRVKFTGGNDLPNYIAALNSYLSNTYGITVIRASMNKVENDVLDDLEEVRTEISEVKSLDVSRSVRIENAKRTIEADLREKRKGSRSASLKLQQADLQLATSVSEKVNAKRQELLASARRRLDERISQVNLVIADLSARLEKAKALKESLPELEINLNLRKAKLKLAVLQAMLPKQVSIVSVEGIGTGIGLKLAGQILNAATTEQEQPKQLTQA